MCLTWALTVVPQLGIEHGTPSFQFSALTETRRVSPRNIYAKLFENLPNSLGGEHF